jgi:hypothetical protein
VLPLLFASGAGAQSIIWTYNAQIPKTDGYLPRLTNDVGGNWTMIAESGTRFSNLEFETGVATNAWEYNFNSFFRRDATGGPISWYPTPNSPWIENAPEGTAVAGHAPSIAEGWSSGPGYGYDWLLEVHQGNTQGLSLWYTLGGCAMPLSSSGCVNNAVTWYGSPQQYDEGFNPSVSIDAWNGCCPFAVVEVHQANTGMTDLWYHVGSLSLSGSKPSVTWGLRSK